MKGLMYISQQVGKYLIIEITSQIFWFYKEITGQIYKEITGQISQRNNRPDFLI